MYLGEETALPNVATAHSNVKEGLVWLTHIAQLDPGNHVTPNWCSATIHVDTG